VGLGREVADAYISVHGDLKEFRKDLGKAMAEGEALGQEFADSLSKGFADRGFADIQSKWASITDALVSDNADVWDRMFGKFDTSDLDAAHEKIIDFMKDMEVAGKLTAEQNKVTAAQIDKAIKAAQQQQFVEKDLAAERARATAAHQAELKEIARLEEAMSEGEKKAAKIRTRLLEDAIRENQAWNDRRKKTMEEAIAENERWARTFEGMTKNTAIKDLESDFRKLADAMVHNDMHSFAKTFDEDWLALRDRVMAVTDAMSAQGRLTEENRRKIHDAIDEHIAMEDDLRRATARTTSEVAYAKIAQDRYNKSLEGMIESSRVQRLERDFRNLSDAIDSGNWDKVARGHQNMDTFRFAVRGTAEEMRRLGRISDGAFSTVLSTIDALDINFKKSASSSKDLGFSLGKNNALLSVMGKGVENVVGKLKGMAGFNVVGDVFREGGEFIQNLDRNAVKIAKIATAAGGLVSVIGSSIGGIATIANDLAKAAGGLSILGPGFLTGAGIGIGVLVTAFKDMKTVLKDLGPQFSRLQDSISAKFWEQAQKPIRELVKNLFPTLEKQLGNTAASMGKLTGAFADAFKNAATPERVTGMFERMNRAIDILQGAMAPLTRAFVTLGDTGSKYFGRFASWIVKVSEQFDAFIQKSADNGDLDKWVERGIQGLKDLGSVISSTTRMFGSISDAARAAGSKGLAGFAENMRNIASFMESPRFQKALTGVFEGFYATLGGIKEGLKAVGRGMEAFVPSFQRISGSLGQVFETLGLYIEKFLTNKTLQDGVEKFFAGINTALTNLSPAITPMADSLGQLFSLMADVLPNVTTIIAKIATTWGPTFDRMLESIKPLIKPVTDLALVFIEKMGPVFDTFVKEVLPPLVDLFAALLPWIELLVKLLTPALIEILRQAGVFFKTMADGLKDFNTHAGPALDWLGKIADKVKDVKFPQEVDLGGLGAGKFAAKLAIAFAQSEPAIATAVGTFLNKTTKGIQESLKNGINFGGMIGDLFNPATMPQTITDITADVILWAKGVGEGIEKGFKGLVEAAKAVFTNLYNDIKKEFQKFMASLLGLPVSSGDKAEVSIGGGAGGVSKSPTGTLDPAMLGLGKPEGMFDNLLIGVGVELAKFFSSVDTTITLLGAAQKIGWDNLWSGMSGSAETSMASSDTSVTTHTGTMSTNLATFIATNAPAWAAFFTQSQTDANTNMAANAVTVASKTGEMGTSIGSFIGSSGPAWATLFTTMAATVATKFGEMRTNTATGLATIASTIVTGTQNSSRNMASGFVQIAAEVGKGWAAMTRKSESGSDDNTGVARSLPGKMVAAMGWLYGKFSPLGQDAMDGFKAGIESRAQSIASAAAAVVGAAILAAKAAQNSNSPSKVFMGLGRDGGDGYALGLDKSESRVIAAAGAMAAIAVDTVTDQFAKSKMYSAGVTAAMGLAAGLKDSRSTISSAMGELLPDLSGTLNVGGVGAPTPVAGKTVIIETLNMPVTTPAKNPETVASMVIDELVSVSNL
jgi:hypothetical protein